MKRVVASFLLIWAISIGCKKSDPAPPNDINQSDRVFIRDASLFNAAAVRINQFVDTTTSDTLIRNLARVLSTDHVNIRNSFNAIAGGFAYYTKDSLDAVHAALKAQLDTLTGRSFDSVYIHQQKADHQAAIVLFSLEKDSGLNVPVRQFATSLIPMLQNHLKSIDSLAKYY